VFCGYVCDLIDLLTMEEADTKLVESEVAPFLSPTARADLRAIAVQYFLGLTGSETGRRYIVDNGDYLQQLINVIDDEQAAIAKDAFLAIVNLAAESDIACRIMKLTTADKVLDRLLTAALYEGRVEPNIACMALSNLSRSESAASLIAEYVIKERDPDVGVKRIVDVLCRSDLPGRDYLAPFLSNLTQVSSVRKILLDHDRVVFQRILPIINYTKSATRRGGIVGTVRNCCFETGMSTFLVKVSLHKYVTKWNNSVNFLNMKNLLCTFCRVGIMCPSINCEFYYDVSL